MDMKKNPIVKFEEMNFDEVLELEEVVTASWGTIECCPKS